jgi:hypothetical protein
LVIVGSHAGGDGANYLGEAVKVGFGAGLGLGGLFQGGFDAVHAVGVGHVELASPFSVYLMSYGQSLRPAYRVDDIASGIWRQVGLSSALPITDIM